MSDPFSLHEHPIDATLLHEALCTAKNGGIVIFEGRVRNHHEGRAVVRLAYQAYSELAVAEGTRVVEEIRARHGVEAFAVHATGDLSPGDLAVWVGVASAHRGEAFEACRELIDAIKSCVPIWKHEFYADGTDEWVDPTRCCGYGREPDAGSR